MALRNGPVMLRDMPEAIRLYEIAEGLVSSSRKWSLVEPSLEGSA
jgi:hypothetical protein